MCVALLLVMASLWLALPPMAVILWLYQTAHRLKRLGTPVLGRCLGLPVLPSYLMAMISVPRKPRGGITLGIGWTSVVKP